MKPVVVGSIGVVVVTLCASLYLATSTAAQKLEPAPPPSSKFALATYLPLGVGSETNATTAWFIDTTNNRVISCSTRGGCSAHSIPAP